LAEKTVFVQALNKKRENNGTAGRYSDRAGAKRNYRIISDDQC
jgi:hypothetical protein